MKFFIVIFIFAISFTKAESEVRPQEIFKFANSYKCNNQFPHHSFCKAVQFKKWKKEEIEFLKDTLSKLNDPKLQHMLKTIQEKGINQFHRVSYSASWYPNHSQRRAEFSRRSDKVLIWVDPVTKVVGFMDSFFSSKEFIDPYANISRKTFNVLHELTHIYDIATGHISNSVDLKEAVGWHWNGKHHVINDIKHETVQQEFQKLLSLVKAGDSHLAYAQDRHIGIKYGFPTLYSMMNSHENFAELLSYYILDPQAKQYLSQKIQDELDKILNP